VLETITENKVMYMTRQMDASNLNILNHVDL
jgi:hypothetical protein